MPLYEFYCPNCNQSVEVLMSHKEWKDGKKPLCPNKNCFEQMGTMPEMQPCLTLMGPPVVSWEEKGGQT